MSADRLPRLGMEQNHRCGKEEQHLRYYGKNGLRMLSMKRRNKREMPKHRGIGEMSETRTALRDVIR